MSDSQYPIASLQSDSPALVEQLGSKPKFWFYWQPDDQPWLFKYNRSGTGEHWAEKIAAEIAALIKLPAATVELAEFGGKEGCASRSFVSKKEGYDLVHGDELLAGHVLGYQKNKTFHQCEHTIHNITAAISKVFPDATQRDKQLSQFAGYIVLDGLIGNTDRHHQNWGILVRTLSMGGLEPTLAPSFDHASSLGRNVPQAERLRRLKEKSVPAYVAKGRGGIYWQSSDKKAANPLDLAIRASQKWPQYFSAWLEHLRSVDYKDLESIVKRVPDEWMDASQKEFCLAFLATTYFKLTTLSQ